mmetsp:Transcript_27715/g.66796  ORF Transcript_27715/g.66796 Transcript_27715/m.66796 type:complete len:1765 (-) Transcript_27715:143-5437(-)
MLSSNLNNAIVRKQIDEVEFGFYNDEDVRRRSVCEITSSIAMDALGTPLPNGVNDPRLGPQDSVASKAPCVTCCQRHQFCPGHFGHIELCVPVYHPLLFGKILELLRIKCFSCHKLTARERDLNTFKVKALLLQQGKYSEAVGLDEKIATCKHEAKERLIERTGQDPGDRSSTMSEAMAGQSIDQLLRETMTTLKRSRSTSQYMKRSTPPSTFEDAYMRDLVKALISTCKAAKHCPHCSAYSPKIRQDSSNKVFQSALSLTGKRINASEGHELRPALTKERSNSNAEDRHAIADNGINDGMDLDDVANDIERDDDDDSDDEAAMQSTKDKYMSAAEVQAQVRRTWETNPDLCDAVFATQGWEIFFMQAIPVPPNRFRPSMHLGGMVVENAQNAFLNKIIQTNELVRTNFANNEQANAYKAWIELQTQINCFMDSSKDPSANVNPTMGIRQILERKEGIFRKHMMGKRVNFACRSVISPDPYIGTNEIGLPRYFAETLTYPTPVTDINISEMRELVERGPFQYPGARWVEINNQRMDLSKQDPHQREAIAARLLTHARRGRPAIVGRQLRDGDMVLMNRQPSLHKPSIMAHEVRVLHNPTQKTIRMHYANCNTYNADYDGDEMNCHFPQSDLGRSEAKYIAKTDLQYIVPTDGSPLRGLIQDHVVGGVKLTKRDTFLEKWEYQQLLFAALASLPGLELIRSDSDIELLPPTILRPKELWTGKQVISTLLNHLRKGNDRDLHFHGELPGLSNERKAKTAGAAFGEAMEEHLVIVRDGELLRGVLDKAAFGATDFGLVHAVYEAYGPSKAGLLLNSLGRLFTAYIQFYSGHSCRMEDLILTKEADETRRKLIQKAYTNGSRAAKAWADSEGGKVPIETDEKSMNDSLKPVEAASAASKVRQLLSGSEGKTNHAALDGFMMSKLNPLASDIVKACLPGGLAVPFPVNTFGIMCGTGAKGSIVNQSQVSCALGQQALEGRRVPRLSSGRTLPSFAPYDVNPRSDGFVMDRFLTGIRPQEYYFHCMAGREGLVDTAVKTSRSGYLQRCLVKHLEELKVSYDFTVRNGEGGVVQFLYGEDGLDPTKCAYLDCTDKSFTYIARNHASLKRGQTPLPDASISVAAKDAKRALECNDLENRKPSKIVLRVGDSVIARKLRIGSEWARGALCEGWFDAIVTKVRKKEGTYDVEYIDDGTKASRIPTSINFGGVKAASSTCELLVPAPGDPVLSVSRGSVRLGSSGACVSEKIASSAAKSVENSVELRKAMKSNALSKEEFGKLVAAKFTAALADPGEAVGCIAAQSIGEPSTQMTLNTFHLAGAGANVTLGIPRLREIIMTASRELKTPTMSVPLHESVTEEETTKLTRSFTKLTLNELIAGHHGVSVRETLVNGGGGMWQRAYYVVLKLHPAERIKTAFGLSLQDIAQVVSKSFVPALSYQMKLELRRSSADIEGVAKKTSVDGGESSIYVHKSTRFDGDDGDEGMGAKKDTNEQDDPLDKQEDDDDGDDNEEVDAEDGVMASRKQDETYDEVDEDHDDEEGGKHSDDGDLALNVSDDEGDDLPKATNFFSSNDEFRVDSKTNTIHLAPFKVDPSARALLMVGLVEQAARKVLVRSKKKIDEAFINDEEGRGRCLQTAGINFEEMWKLENVDHSRLMSNDIWAIRCSYGVEAARNNIVEQIRSVFGVYGIEVDPRHLSLIGDYMTFGGDYTAMNRTGMREMSSPFLQMSFETTAQFLTQAALMGNGDQLNSPSANIVVGRPVRHGTGAFTLMVK